tara:strand:- start:1172 stop:1306 length:135 start_codon:yes stop_codon:yes gene_type:complete
MTGTYDCSEMSTKYQIDIRRVTRTRARTKPKTIAVIDLQAAKQQ